MATLAAQKISQSGVAPAYQAAAAGGDEFANGGRTVFHVKNGSAAAVTVTVKSQKPCNQGGTHDLTVSVPAGGDRMIGPFDPARFNNSSGRVAVTYSAVTTITVAPLEV